jgi:hypothetical protein
MAKKDSDLFDRLRRAGLRKQVATALSEIGEGAGKKAGQMARSTVDELRSIADEIERRLPGAKPQASPVRKAAGRTKRRSPASTPRAPRSRPAGAGSGRGASRPVARRKPRAATAAKPATARPTKAPAARGQNKAKILSSLKAGPKTASEIARDTRIGTTTVSSTLTKLLRAGDVAKAERGYRLPM